MFDYNEEHKNLCNDMHEIYLKKNADYGDSFSKLYNEYGSIVSEIHIKEKFERFKQLRTNPSMVDESIEDTLMDMADYCILTILEMKKVKADLQEMDLTDIPACSEEPDTTELEAETVLDNTKEIKGRSTHHITARVLPEEKSQFKREWPKEYLYNGVPEEEVKILKSSNGCLK